MKFLLGLIGFVWMICVFALAIIYISLVVRNELNFPGEVAQIEQLRSDSAKVSVQESEDVVGQITFWNQLIASNQRYNKIWWSHLVIPDGWDEIMPIPIPNRQ